MKTIEYTSDGRSFADDKVEEEARHFLSSEEDYIKVSNNTFVLAARTLIHEKFIPHTEVVFLFKGTKLLPNKDGRLEYWPDGFCDIEEKLYSRMLTNVGK